LIYAIRKIALSRQAARDDLVHHIWGISPHPKLRDALLLVDPKELIRSPDNIDRDRVYVYEKTI